VFDPVTLDQLRAFVTVVEEGSFSAAARKLKRVQSAISTSMANLEEQLGVPLWDRSTKVAKLTAQGRAILAAAQRVLLEVDVLKRVSAGMVLGLEASVSLCVEALFPLSILVASCAEFAAAMPSVDLRVDTQSLSAVSARVLTGDASIGVVAGPGLVPGVAKTQLMTVAMIPVVAPTHPLATYGGLIPPTLLAAFIQIVLSERNDVGLPDQGVLSPRTWRVADLHAKHAMLRGGLGWGNLPAHMIASDLQAGTLVPIKPEAFTADDGKVTLFAIHRNEATFGPAQRWLVLALTRLCARAEAETAALAGKSGKVKRSKRA
jgi:DNA-binding transcriptional LysR family regulator